MAAQIPNDNTPFKPMLGLGSRGVVQCVHDGSNNASLYGSVNGTNYALIHEFTASEIKEVALCPYLLIASANDGTITGAVNAGTTVFIDETR